MAVAVTLMDRFQARTWRNFRASMFVALGLYGLAPIIHQWVINRDVPQVWIGMCHRCESGTCHWCEMFHTASHSPHIPTPPPAQVQRALAVDLVMGVTYIVSTSSFCTATFHRGDSWRVLLLVTYHAS